MRDAEAEAGLGPRSHGDPYAPYQSPDGESPYDGGYNDPFGQSNQQLPLVQNAQPMYDEYDERKSLRSDDYDGRSAYTSHRDIESASVYTESYAPSRNMFQDADKKGLLSGKEPLAGEIQEGETTEVIKESSLRKRWVMLCWLLTFWCPTPFLRWFGRMKRPDVQQAWREKLAINMLIWFVCGCAVFIIAIFGNLICPTEHVFTTSELEQHSYKNSPNNVYTSIRGEVFDLTEIAVTHLAVVPVVSSKSVLNYGGVASDNIFPVQVGFQHYDFRVSLLTISLGQRALQRCLWFSQPLRPTFFGQRYGHQRSVSRLPCVDRRLATRLVFRADGPNALEQPCRLDGLYDAGPAQHGGQG